MAGLGQMEAVADEDERRVDPGRGRSAAHPEEDVAGNGERGAGRPRHQRCTRGAGSKPGLLQTHRLEIGAVLASRLEAELAEAPGDEIGGAPMARTAGFAALHIIGGERRDRRPPGLRAFGLRGRRLGLGEGGGSQRGQRDKQERQTHAPS
jgi:hypothetical protein